MPATISELATLTRITGRRTTSKLAPRASTVGIPASALRAASSVMGIPSLLAKLLPESGSGCSPICLESLEAAPADHYLGTNESGVAGIWPIPGGVEEAPVDGAFYARRNAAWFPTSVYYPAAPGPAAPNGLYAGIAKGLIYSQLDPTLSYVLRLWTFDGVPGETTGWK